MHSRQTFLPAVQAEFSFPDDEFTSKVATSQKEVTELIEAGYEFVLQKDGLAYFRKQALSARPIRPQSQSRSGLFNIGTDVLTGY